MALFEGKDLAIKTRILEETGSGVLMEVAFIGIHDHLSRIVTQSCDLIKADFLKKNAAACLFDFTGYEYEFGDEIGGPFMSILVARGGPAGACGREMTARTRNSAIRRHK